MPQELVSLESLKGKKLVPDNWRDLPDLTDVRFIGLDLSKPPVPGKLAICLLCAKPFIMPQFLGEPDQACPDCINRLRDTAVLVCNRCKRVIARHEPKVLDCGFYIRPRMVLHTDKCNNCDPGVVVSKVIEIENWMRTHWTPKTIVPVTNPYVEIRRKR